MLWQLDEQASTFTCHIGHSFEPDTLLAAQSRILQQAVVEAVRLLKEKSMLLRQLALRLNPHDSRTALLVEEADQHEEHARLLQTHLGDDSPDSIDTTDHVVAEIVREMRQEPDD